MITRLRYDPDLDCMVEIRPQSNYFEETAQGPQLIRDDMGGINGLKAMYRMDGKRFDSKSRYRADVRAHGLEEVGNEHNFASKSKPKEDYGQVVKDAYEQFNHNHNGTADIVRQQEQRTEWRRRNG